VGGETVCLDGTSFPMHSGTFSSEVTPRGDRKSSTKSISSRPLVVDSKRRGRSHAGFSGEPLSLASRAKRAKPALLKNRSELPEARVAGSDRRGRRNGERAIASEPPVADRRLGRGLPTVDRSMARCGPLGAMPGPREMQAISAPIHGSKTAHRHHRSSAQDRVASNVRAARKS
jgi:hypothetical protein